MSETYWTSDNHFWHRNILKFQKEKGTRMGIDDIQEMNEVMIQNWNEQVKPGDTVHCLGDFSFGTVEKTTDIIKRLNGNIELVRGNHDKVLNTLKHMFTRFDVYREIKFDKKHVVMFHFPIFEWNRMHHGAYHLYGHVHGNVQVPGRAMDVGIDARPQKDMRLFTWDDIRNTLENKEVRPHGDGKD